MPCDLFPEEMAFAEELSAPVLAWTAPVRGCFPVSPSFPAQENNGKPEISSATNLDQPDLYYLESVLCTAGFDVDPDRDLPVGWNNNDDVFDPAETWVARSTPVDKPLNLGHDCARIIGHITECYAEDLTGATLASGSEDVAAPSAFNLVTKGVLYRVWWTGKEHDTAREEEVERVVAELPDGKWGVSMECLVGSFDYALYADGKVQVIQRTKSTAHLSKHLRRAKGSGEYQGKRIGRLLRNLTFSGKGIVANPANPKSVVRAETAETPTAPTFFDRTNEKLTENPPENLAASREGVYPQPTPAESGHKPRVKPEPQMEIEALKGELTAAKSALSAAQTELAEFKAQAAKASEAKLASVTAELETERKAKADLTSASQAATAQVKAELDKLVEAKAALETELAEAKESLAKVEADKADLARAAQVADALKLDPEAAAKLVASLKGFDDKAFADHIELVAALTVKSGTANSNNSQQGNTNFGGKSPKQPEGKTGLGVPGKKTPLPTTKSAFAADEGGEDGGDSEAVTAATEDGDTPDLAVAETQKRAEKVRMTLAKAFGYQAETK